MMVLDLIKERGGQREHWLWIIVCHLTHIWLYGGYIPR